MTTRNKNHRDKNEKEIIRALERCGASVQRLCVPTAKGVPDLLVGIQSSNYLIEVKTEKGKLSPDQIKFKDEWKGQIFIIRSTQEAIDWIQSVRRSIR